MLRVCFVTAPKEYVLHSYYSKHWLTQSQKGFCFGLVSLTKMPWLKKKDDNDAENWYIRHIKSKDEILSDLELKLITCQKDSWQFSTVSSEISSEIKPCSPTSPLHKTAALNIRKHGFTTVCLIHMNLPTWKQINCGQGFSSQVQSPWGFILREWFPNSSALLTLPSKIMKFYLTSLLKWKNRGREEGRAVA